MTIQFDSTQFGHACVQIIHIYISIDDHDSDNGSPIQLQIRISLLKQFWVGINDMPLTPTQNSWTHELACACVHLWSNHRH